MSDELKQSVTDMTVGEWISITLQEQVEAFGNNPPALEGEARGDFFHTQLTGAYGEVTEIGDELGWKPWTKPRGWANRHAVISEVCDLMHFTANILATIGCTGEELTTAYRQVVQKNYDRQAKIEGDDIRRRRCGGCGRSLDDVGTMVLAAGSSRSRVCKACHHEVSTEEG